MDRCVVLQVTDLLYVVFTCMLPLPPLEGEADCREGETAAGEEKEQGNYIHTVGGERKEGRSRKGKGEGRR